MKENIIPGDFNAHSHPEQSIYVEIADKGWELSRWCRETIYKYSVSMTYERVYYACVRAFGRMLSYGETSVMVSFYCHNNRGNELDRAVIRAARDVGIRLFFGRMNYDIVTEDAYVEKQDSQRSYFETPEEAEKNFIELLGEECETVVVMPALHSFHANTLDAIIRGINLGAEYEKRVQFHLSEDEGDVKLCLENYGRRPVEVLESLVKNGRVPRLDHVVLSDCVWTDGEASNDDLSIRNEREWLIKTHGLSDMEAGMLKRPFEAGGIKVGCLGDGCAEDYQVMRNGKIEELYVGGHAVMKNGELFARDLTLEADRYIKDLWV